MFRTEFIWAIILLTAFPLSVCAVYEKQNGDEFPWGMELKGFHDEPVVKKLGKGFFMNVGPTGIRARITHKHPCYFTVKFVFEDSPAYGKIEAGDIVVGANGKVMKVPHQFGRRNVIGWDGPMTEMAKLIEDSQGKDGKLELIVWPKGKKENEKKVILQIEAVGRFSDTFPYNCERSNKLMIKLCEFLADEYKREGGLKARPHTYSAVMLALMASGEKKYDSLIKKEMAKFYGKTYDSQNGGGFPVWGFGMHGIVMGEYYNLYKDKKILSTIKNLNTCMEESLDFRAGSYSHKPFSAIQTRIYDNGSFKGAKGYGAMAFPGGLIMTALSIFKHSGLEYSEKTHTRIHQAYLGSMGSNGDIGYGFEAWQHAIIEVDSSAEKSPKGVIGFECPSGMKGAGKYKILWPTKADPRYIDTSWVEKEASTNRVFYKGANQRMVVRVKLPKEPSKAFSKAKSKVDHYGRSGAGALAHLIGGNDKSWVYTGNLLASGCAKSSKKILGGHASTLMHPMWGSLGAAMADEKQFREYMDGIRWWFIMAQTHNNGFVAMPGRDYASTDHVYATRKFPSGIAALILSLKEKKLLITGSASGKPATQSSSRAVVKKVINEEIKPLVINTKQKEKLNTILLLLLENLSMSKGLEPITVPISKTKAKVWLKKVTYNGSLTFQLLEDEQEATFKFKELTLTDYASLARLHSVLNHDSQQAHAIAAVYMHLIGAGILYKHYLSKTSEDQVNKVLSLLNQ
ncbi:MAG: DUF6288 domain-containing protein [Lentisphaeraceae bacterium]|nr:DUF6288 domain-containing protein [Lentisphaeraceae bacterium]